MIRYCAGLLVVFCLIFQPCWVLATEPERVFGLRGGVDFEGHEEDYLAAEVFVLGDFSWQQPLADDLVLRPGWEISGGYLGTDNDEGAFLTAGLNFALVFFGDSLEFEIGIRPTWLSRHRYGDDDLGGSLQFTSHAGLGARWHNLLIQYRVQHISNAGLSSPNPGLNLHLLGLGLVF